MILDFDESRRRRGPWDASWGFGRRILCRFAPRTLFQVDAAFSGTTAGGGGATAVSNDAVVVVAVVIESGKFVVERRHKSRS